MRHIHAYKLAATYKVKLMYFLVNIHINKQSTLYEVNSVIVTVFRKTTSVTISWSAYTLFWFEQLPATEFVSKCGVTTKII
jgi:hypothetical protein